MPLLFHLPTRLAPSPASPQGRHGAESAAAGFLRRRRRSPPLAPVLPRPRPPSLWQGERGSIPLVDRLIVEFV
jgi:hypothetical protein